MYFNFFVSVKHKNDRRGINYLKFNVPFLSLSAVHFHGDKHPDVVIDYSKWYIVMVQQEAVILSEIFDLPTPICGTDSIAFYLICMSAWLS